jgi:hypothetical protein
MSQANLQQAEDRLSTQWFWSRTEAVLLTHGDKQPDPTERPFRDGHSKQHSIFYEATSTVAARRSCGWESLQFPITARPGWDRVAVIMYVIWSAHAEQMPS